MIFEVVELAVEYSARLEDTVCAMHSCMFLIPWLVTCALPCDFLSFVLHCASCP